MVKNLFTAAYRNIKNHKTISTINIVGLAISLSSFLLIFTWVLDQLNYDIFFQNSDCIYRINTEIKGKGTSIFSADNVAPSLKESYPEILKTCRVLPSTMDIVFKYGDKEFYESGELMADPNFFDFFSYELLKGDRKTILNNKKNIVITEIIASRIFGTANPIGKVLIINPGNHPRELIVSGVTNNVKSNSHLKFNCITPLQNIPFWGNGWEYAYLVTYIQAVKNINVDGLENKIADFIKKYNKNTLYKLHLQPLKDIHLYSSHLQDATIYSDPGDIKYIYIFSVTAFIILLLASANFINLSIAGYFKKIREAGVKKIVGATQRQLVFQFLNESMIVVFIASILSVVIFLLIVPYFKQLFGIELKFHFFDYKIVIGFLVIILFTGIISGSYPAFVLASSKPINVLKNTYHKNIKATNVRTALVIFQFILSIGMIICALVINRQLDFILKKNLGFNKEKVIYFVGHNLPFDPKEELLRISNVSNVSWGSELPISVTYKLMGTKWNGIQNDNLNLYYLKVDQDFINTFNVKMKEGRNFSKEFSQDEYSYLLNESAVKAMKLKLPVGSQLICRSGLGDEIPGTIIGVVKDFHSASLHNKIEPLVMGMHIGKPWYVFVKIKDGELNSTINQIRDKFNFLYPDIAFNYQFLDKKFENQYAAEKIMSNVFIYFSLLIILISCLGLFGMVKLSIEHSRKEIGMRKVLGASVSDIVLLFSKNYIIRILIAASLTFPLTFLLMKKWLEGFAYRIELSWYFFALSAGIVLLVALVTLSLQTIKAATANPVESLRYE
jgi:putative ABC transport system permease protein